MHNGRFLMPNCPYPTVAFASLLCINNAVSIYLVQMQQLTKCIDIWVYYMPDDNVFT